MKLYGYIVSKMWSLSAGAHVLGAKSYTKMTDCSEANAPNACGVFVFVNLAKFKLCFPEFPLLHRSIFM